VIFLTVFFGLWRHNDDIRWRHLFDLFTVPLNSVYVKLWGLVTKIRFWWKTYMIQKGTGGTAPKKVMKELAGKGWSKSGLLCSVVSNRDKSIVLMNWNGSWSIICVFWGRMHDADVRASLRLKLTYDGLADLCPVLWTLVSASLRLKLTYDGLADLCPVLWTRVNSRIN